MRKAIATLIDRLDFITAALEGAKPSEEVKKAVMAIAKEAFQKSRSREEDDFINDALVFLLSMEEINELSKGA